MKDLTPEQIKAKRDSATYRAYRRLEDQNEVRYIVKAREAGKAYLIVRTPQQGQGGGDRADVLAPTCDEALTRYLRARNIQ